MLSIFSFASWPSVCLHVIGMNLEDILSERSQPQKTVFYIISFIYNVQKRQIHRDRKQISGFPGAGGRRE